MGKQRSTRRVIARRATAVLAMVAAIGVVVPGFAHAAPPSCVYNGGPGTEATDGPDVIVCPNGILPGERLRALGGNDFVTVLGNVGGEVDLGEGDDLLDLQGNTTGLIHLGSGNDAAVVTGDMVVGELRSDTSSPVGAGTDIVTVTGNVGDGEGFAALIDLGYNNDSVTIGGTVLTGSTVAGSQGNDTFDVASNTGVVSGGVGNDQMRVTLNSGVVRGDRYSDFLFVVANLGIVDGGPHGDTCLVVDGNPPQNC